MLGLEFKAIALNDSWKNQSREFLLLLKDWQWIVSMDCYICEKLEWNWYNEASSWDIKKTWDYY